MKILHVFDHSLPIQDGYSYRSRAILVNQRALGWETVQLTGSKHATTVAWEEVAGLGFYRTPAVNGAAARFPFLGQLQVVTRLRRRVRELVRQERPDLIHAHSPSLNGLAAASVARAMGTPLVYEIRAFWEDAAVDQGTSREGGLRYRLTAASEARVLGRADAVTTICEGLRGELLRRGLSAEKVSVIPNGVEASAYAFDRPKDAALAAQLGLEGKFVVGFVGSFYAYEGLDLLLAAFPALRAALPEARLLLVGGGMEDEALRRQARALGVEDAVVFAGRVPHDEVERYYSLFDIACFPRHSLRLTELVTPLKPLEAMAMGRVCVASNVGGHRELIQDGETGYLFEADDAEALTARLIDVAGCRDEWPALKAAGRKLVETERSWPTIVRRYIPIYEALLAEKQKHHRGTEAQRLL